MTAAPQEWSVAALEKLDILWAVDTRMGIMQRRLFDLMGFPVSPQDIRTMATRPRPPKAVPELEAVIADQMAARPAPVPIPLVIPVHFGFVPPPRVDNPLRKVRPGTYRVPVGGFSMLRSDSR